ncbi:hypothetical protein WR25_14240, partial [Diploscapter pachys]
MNPQLSMSIFNTTAARRYIIVEALSTNATEEFIKQERYDIGLTTDYEFCGHVILFKNGLSSIASYSAMPIIPETIFAAGLPSPASSFTPFQPPVNPYSIWSRFMNAIRLGEAYYIDMKWITDEFTKIAREKYGPDFPDVEQLIYKLDVIFVNSNQVFEPARPISHKTKYIGGIALKQPKPLNEDMNEMLSKAKRGNVIVAFGSQILTKAMPFELRRHFVRAFNKFPEFSFIWRYDEMEDDDVLFENSTNIHRIKWLPQIDLLNDERVVGFVTHAGLNSILEASFAGIPMIAIPIFADQPYNALSGKQRGTTFIIDKVNVNEDTLAEGLSAILYDESYMENAKRISKLMKENPEQGKDVFINWVEYAANNKELYKINSLPGSDLTPFTYYLIDVTILCTIASLLVLYLVLKTILFIYKFVSLKMSQKVKVN